MLIIVVVFTTFVFFKQKATSPGKYVLSPTKQVHSPTISSKTTEQPQNQSAGKSKEKPTYQSKTKSFGRVEVKVTLKRAENGKDTIFILSLNTHSVNLTYDYTKIATVKDNQGNNYKTLKWSGPTGGHHIVGELTVEPLKIGIQQVTISLSGIDRNDDSFIWKL